MYELSAAGIEAFDVYTKAGRFACVMVNTKRGWSLYWDTNCGRGSARKFQTAAAALEFMHQRRITKGLPV